jgi:hypothetical protein
VKAWGRTLLVLAVLWLLTRWIGIGFFLPDARTIALWAAILLAVFLLWRDGRGLLARYGLTRNDAPLAVLEIRLARGELDLDTFRQLRTELSAAAGIAGAAQNRQPERVLRGDRRE